MIMIGIIMLILIIMILEDIGKIIIFILNISISLKTFGFPQNLFIH